MLMITAHLGEFAALLTAIFWTIAAVVFESAGKKVGSSCVNFMKLIFGFLLIGVYTSITRGMFLPLDASSRTWTWLLLSGLVGFVLGDLFLFQAYIEIGSRVSMLVMSLAPPIAAVISYIVLGEKLTKANIIGMVITIIGIAIVVLKKDDSENKIQFSHPIRGLVFALLGAIGQAGGLVLSKLGMQDYNAFAATQIRTIAGICGFAVLIFIMKGWDKVFSALKNISILKTISLGSIFGPFLGVSFTLIAIQYTSTAVASTITSIVPVLIIPPAILIFKEKITSREILGSIVTIIGVGVLFI
ncbi:EamA family transporter [Clostridium bovifaecis]|uniref:EamA family transporter n=1 Tax=Clostridium bovifaecis TaxID=2184719 RepID=A0A6I6F8I4_9CLOT|nr:EamA family transporter [Clostridium bovifaecis]